MLEWFLLIISKEYTLTRSTYLLSRNRDMSCFRLRIDVQYLLVTLWLEVQKQPFADVLQNRCSLKFHNICKKTPVLQLFLTKLLTCRPVAYLKSNSSTGVFLCLFQNFKENLFWKTSASGCFWNLMKVFWFMT